MAEVSRKTGGKEGEEENMKVDRKVWGGQEGVYQGEREGMKLGS